MDARADIYPVGVILYRMMTGALPIEPFKKLSQSNPDLDPDWDAFIDQAVAGTREKRFASAKNILDSLDALSLAWEEKEEEKACRMPQMLAPKRRHAQKTKEKPRAQGVKVAPREGRKVFKVDKLWRPMKYIANDLKLNLEGTVTDRLNSLVWQQAGSDHPVNWYEAHKYIEQLNQGRFAGPANWRLPTVNELISLITEVPRAADLCVEPIFDQAQPWLWSADRRSFVAAWYVSLDLGYVWWQDFTCY